MAAAGIRPVEATDEALLVEVQQGDQDAFETLYQRYFPKVHGFLRRRLGNQADVEETTQEVFINLFSSLHTFRGQAPFGAWVFGITRRTLANRFKKRRIEAIHLGAEEMESLPTSHAQMRSSPDPHEAYEFHERIEQMEEAVGAMSPDQRQLFELHHLEFRSIQDIARVTAKSEDAVKSHLYRARKLLLAR